MAREVVSFHRVIICTCFHQPHVQVHFGKGVAWGNSWEIGKNEGVWANKEMKLVLEHQAGFLAPAACFCVLQNFRSDPYHLDK